jgi:vacuolar-type H+-ATPase subunit H
MSNGRLNSFFVNDHGRSITLRDHLELMRAADAEHVKMLRDSDAKFSDERDRRYAEVASEREKALKIKEEADKEALRLAREIQSYKDEKANQLREQIGSERGLYPTKGELNSATEKLEALIKPLASYVSSDQGKGSGVNSVIGYVFGVAGLLVGVGSTVALLLFHR